MNITRESTADERLNRSTNKKYTTRTLTNHICSLCLGELEHTDARKQFGIERCNHGH